MFNVQIPVSDGSDTFGAYAAGDPGDPAIVVVQEIFGINRGIRAKCDALAADGYRAIAPDLFWRLERGVELDPDVPAEFDKAMGYLGRFDRDAAVADIEATIRFARAAGAARVGVVGYCLGGHLAYLAATRTDSDASVGYYGVMIDEKLGEAHAIARPLMLHFAEQDHFVPAEKRAAIHAALDPLPKVTLHDYPGVDHGFATQFGQRRDEAMARLADERTSAFFARHLRSAE